jgi:hypothetical protein
MTIDKNNLLRTKLSFIITHLEVLLSSQPQKERRNFESDDAPWLNLSKEEIDDLRNKKHTLTQYEEWDNDTQGILAND